MINDIDFKRANTYWYLEIKVVNKMHFNDGKQDAEMLKLLGENTMYNIFFQYFLKNNIIH